MYTITSLEIYKNIIEYYISDDKPPPSEILTKHGLKDDYLTKVYLTRQWFKKYDTSDDKGNPGFYPGTILKTNINSDKYTIDNVNGDLKIKDIDTYVYGIYLGKNNGKDIVATFKNDKKYIKETDTIEWTEASDNDNNFISNINLFNNSSEFSIILLSE